MKANFYIQQIACEWTSYYDYEYEVVSMREGEIVETRTFTDYRMAEDYMRICARRV